MAEKILKITKIKSHIGSKPFQREVLKGLGLRKLNQSVFREDTPRTRGMINKIPHMVKWELVDKK